jgi:hypothetical protein
MVCGESARSLHLPRISVEPEEFQHFAFVAIRSQNSTWAAMMLVTSLCDLDHTAWAGPLVTRALTWDYRDIIRCEAAPGLK